MTVRELVNILISYSMDREVALCDTEGNRTKIRSVTTMHEDDVPYVAFIHESLYTD